MEGATGECRIGEQRCSLGVYTPCEMMTFNETCVASGACFEYSTEFITTLVSLTPSLQPNFTMMQPCFIDRAEPLGACTGLHICDGGYDSSICHPLLPSCSSIVTPIPTPPTNETEPMIDCMSGPTDVEFYLCVEDWQFVTLVNRTDNTTFSIGAEVPVMESENIPFWVGWS